MNEIKYLLTYNSAFDLIEDNKPECLDGLPYDMAELIQALDDYESIRYALINDDTVLTMDRMTGTVFNTESLDDFCYDVIQEAQESIE